MVKHRERQGRRLLGQERERSARRRGGLPLPGYEHPAPWPG